MRESVLYGVLAANKQLIYCQDWKICLNTHCCNPICMKLRVNYPIRKRVSLPPPAFDRQIGRWVNANKMLELACDIPENSSVFS